LAVEGMKMYINIFGAAKTWSYHFQASISQPINAFQKMVFWKILFLNSNFLSFYTRQESKTPKRFLPAHKYLQSRLKI
jgi:hypothetical protein